MMKTFSLIALLALLSCTNAAGGSSSKSSGIGESSDSKKPLRPGHSANCNGRIYKWDDFERTRQGFQASQLAKVLGEPYPTEVKPKLYNLNKTQELNKYLYFPMIKQGYPQSAVNNIDHALLHAYNYNHVVDIVMHDGASIVQCTIIEEENTPLRFMDS